MHVRVAYLLVAPLCLLSVMCVVLLHVRAPAQTRSGQVVLFEGVRIKFYKL